MHNVPCASICIRENLCVYFFVRSLWKHKALLTPPGGKRGIAELFIWRRKLWGVGGQVGFEPSTMCLLRLIQGCAGAVPCHVPEVPTYTAYSSLRSERPPLGRPVPNGSIDLERKLHL